MSTRRWPRPPDGAVHLIGDTHFGSVSMTANRKALWVADLERSRMLPESVVHVQVGDFVDNPVVVDTQDAEAIDFADTYFGAGEWVAAVGNHDLYGRTADESAEAWGQPAGNFVRDLGWSRLIMLAPDDGIENDGFSMVPFDETRLDWLDTQLQAAGDTPCLIVCHWSLYDTVEGIPSATASSTTDGHFAEPDADVRDVLADNPNARAWLSGHTHSDIRSAGLVTTTTVGSRQIAAVNASSPAYVGTDNTDLSSLMTTMYVTVTDGRLDVRVRDHGAGRWTVAGPERYAVWSVAA